MINFVKFDGEPYRYFASEREVEEAREELEYHTNRILKDLSDIKQDKFYLGCHLIDLLRSEDYSADPQCISSIRTLDGKIQGVRLSYAFMRYCEKTFGLDKSQVSRYMNIVDEFGDEMRGYKEPWNGYSYSQLVELLPLTAEQRLDIPPSMSVKDIREYKKKLVATSQQEQKASGISVATSQQQNNSQIQVDSKPAESVATSQQECPDTALGALKFEYEFEHELVKIPKSGSNNAYLKYDLCRGFTLKQLCDFYVSRSSAESKLSKDYRELQVKYAELELKYDELCLSINIKNQMRG